MGTAQKVVVITGASQGFGAALVNAYRDRNYRVKQQFEMVARPRFEPTVSTSLRVKRTIGENIVDLCRLGKGGSGLSLPSFYDFARLPSIFCDPLRSMVAPRQRERMNSSHKLRRKQVWGKLRLEPLWNARKSRFHRDCAAHSKRSK